MKRSSKIVCEICKFETTKNGISSHILHKHKMTSDEYVSLYGEYRPSKLSKINYNSENLEGEFACLICDSKFTTNKRLMHHVHSVHQLDAVTYVKRHIFSNEPQYCRCGCTREVNYYIRPPYRSECISGHNSKYANGMAGKFVSSLTRERQSVAAISRGVTSAKRNTNIEILFEKYLADTGIKFISQAETEYGIIDFYLPELDIYVEVDGSYWHPKNLVNLNFNQLSNVVNDIRKNRNIKNLVRITDADIEHSSIDLKVSDAGKCIQISNYDNFLSREFLISYKRNKGEKKLNQKIDLILKFIRAISPDFPYDDADDFDFSLVCKKIESLSSTLEGKTFYNNRCSSVGTRELKSVFRSFFKSKNLRSLSPIEVWNSDSIMHKLIKYRIGLNNSDEVFNISLNQLRRAITVNKYTVSWFKPHLAASIYKKFIGDKDAPVVLDPCAGFGARMLGFYSAYPKGTYIGIEPNKETFDELVKLNNILGKDSVLINDRYENVDISNMSYDLAFTSIPYWDIEIYSEDHTKFYRDYQEWVDVFLHKIKNTKNMIVNIPEMLYNEFDNIQDEYYIHNNSSHFNTASKSKLEYILILNI